MSDTARLEAGVRVRGESNLWALLSEIEQWAEACLNEYDGNYTRSEVRTSTAEDITVTRPTLEAVRREFKERKLTLQGLYQNHRVAAPPHFNSISIDIDAWFPGVEAGTIENLGIHLLAPARIDAERVRESLEVLFSKLQKRNRYADADWTIGHVRVATTDSGKAQMGVAQKGPELKASPSDRRVNRVGQFVAQHVWQVVLGVFVTVVGGAILAFLGLST